MFLQASKVCMSGRVCGAVPSHKNTSPCCCSACPVFRAETSATVPQSPVQAMQPGEQSKHASPDSSREQQDPCQSLTSPVSTTDTHPPQYTAVLATALAAASLCTAFPADAATVMNAEQAHQLQDILRPTFALFTALYILVGLVGGVDISPIIWVALLSFFNEILLGPQGLLVLVERQGGL
ncbi:hypothetical protein DUNSADRAFT_17435 [Dunaliella salina]|uniref:Uncharacterized protein n=1 Tax=Dunaliella salina TaxID=3046 RepID=A0ABQ7H030_DUNSA|nr:hypothetical protein DUNSADRAFT_17435 [Dunaliella salina]|eukprot:KAF5840218.1 hypothetical protein DUNSADRAFT_17435 [Dunaliella salina]